MAVRDLLFVFARTRRLRSRRGFRTAFRLASQPQFVYHQTMNVTSTIAKSDSAPPLDAAISRVAAAIAEPARARMLCSLMDGHARTSTELALVAEVSPSTASVHLQRLAALHLLKLSAQGKHRYYSLDGPDVARLIERLSVLAGARQRVARFAPSTPVHLRAARTCYDHIAGTLGVALHDRFRTLGWLARRPKYARDAYELTPAGMKAFAALGLDLEAAHALRRRFAFACLDWSERRPHLAGSLGAAFLSLALKRKWVLQDLHTRALELTVRGRREMLTHFGVRI
jgi:DNA-binding transcriptional ArsR family regulator